MEDASDLHDWEILSDSDTNSIAFEEIVRSDYFALDSNSLHQKDEGFNDSMVPQPEAEKGGSFLAGDRKIVMGFVETESSVVNFGVNGPDEEMDDGGINNGGSFLVDDSKMDMRFEGTELGHQNSLEIDPKIEVGIEEIAEGNSLDGDGSKLELSFEGSELESQNSCVIDSKHESDAQEMQRDDSKMEVGVEEIGPIDENSSSMKGLGYDSSIETGNSEIISARDGEKKVLIWWKMPLDILKLCASKVRPVWSISIAAAVIGILMVGRRLYKMKHKSRRVPLKVSYEDKKAASKLLISAARLNEVIVRRVPIIRSPPLLAPGGGITPWPALALR